MSYPIYTEITDPTTGEVVCINRDDSETKGCSIPLDLGNSDYQRYLEQLKQ